MAPLVFLFFLLFPFASVVFLQGAQWYLKWHAAARMEGENLVTIALPESKVYWEKPQKELRINGRLFDIKTYAISQGMLTATGFYDEKEALVESLLSLLPHDKKHNILLQPFLLLQCFLVTISLITVPGLVRKSIRLHKQYTCYLPQPFSLILERPPRL